MMDELNVLTNQFGGKVFHLKVEYVCLDLDSIVNSFLYWTEKGEEDSSYSPKPYLPWTEFDRATAIKCLSHWLMEEGNRANTEGAYPWARKQYGGMAQRFAEELFPELVYDKNEFKRNFEAFEQTMLKGRSPGSHSGKELLYDDDADIAF